MADVSLDDLIKKDKEKNKLDRLKNKLQGKKFVNRNRPADNFDNRGDRRPRENFPEKHRPIRKQFENNREERWERGQKDFREKRQERDRPFEKREEGEKQFRTLKVMGLSPEFTNEDLYVTELLCQKLFAAEGALEKCLIEQDNFGRTLTTAIVKYHEPMHATNAIQNLNRHKVMNCILTVEPYKNIKNN